MSDTQALLYAIAIYVFGFALMFWNWGVFTATVVRWSKKPVKKAKSTKVVQPKLKFGEKVVCYIPFIQIGVLRRTLYGKGGILNVISIISLVGIVLNLLNKFVLPINGYVMLAFNFIMLFCVALFYLSYAIATATCARLYGFSWLTTILCFLFPHWVCWYLNNNIPTKVKALQKEDTFRENTRDTVIKQRSHK